MSEVKIDKVEFTKEYIKEFSSLGTLSTSVNKQKASDFTKDDIDRYLNTPQDYPSELQNISDWFYKHNGIYKNIINSFANLPTLDYMPIPSKNTMQKKADKSYDVYLGKIYEYMDSLNIKLTTRRILKSVARYGVYVGYERNEGNEFTYQTLPIPYTRIKHKIGNDYQLEFNFKYFDNFYKKEDLDFAWSVYPSEFKKLYNKYKNTGGTGSEWQPLDFKRTIYIPFDDDEPYPIPMFSGMFEALLNNEDYKDIIKQGEALAITKLLVQLIPTDSEGNILSPLEVARSMHNNLMKVLPVNAHGLTTPYKIDSVAFANQTQEKEQLLAKAERGVFINSGFSSAIFADNGGHTGLQINLENTTANIYAVLEKIEDAISKKFKNVVTSKNYAFKLKFFRTTNINVQENFDRMMQVVAIGGVITPLFSILGINPSDYITLLEMEDDLGIKDLMIPPQSMHTQTQGTVAGDKGGTPEKQEKDLSEEGQKTRNLDANNNRPTK